MPIPASVPHVVPMDRTERADTTDRRDILGPQSRDPAARAVYRVSPCPSSRPSAAVATDHRARMRRNQVTPAGSNGLVPGARSARHPGSATTRFHRRDPRLARRLRIGLRKVPRGLRAVLQRRQVARRPRACTAHSQRTSRCEPPSPWCASALRQKRGGSPHRLDLGRDLSITGSAGPTGRSGDWRCRARRHRTAPTDPPRRSRQSARAVVVPEPIRRSRLYRFR